MSTRELIEAVREPERIKVNEWWKGGFMTVQADDYDALRAATVAVLEALEAACDHGQSRETFEIAMDNARALLEKLK